LLELLSWLISTGDLPLFVIDTFFEAVLPTLTSPKSIVPGFTSTEIDSGLVDEKARESDPQPDITMHKNKQEPASPVAKAVLSLLIV
jgi:hypothetical protein